VKQVCIIGNSHVAALKLAWTNGASELHRGLALSFFSAQNYMLDQIEREGRTLAPQRRDAAEKLRFTSGGLDRIEIDRYDAIVLVASGFGIDIPKLRSQCGTPAHEDFSRVEQLVSTACFDAVLEATFESSRAIALIDMIREVAPDKTVVLAAAPYMSARLLDGNDELHMREPAALRELVARARAIGERVAAERGCPVIWQDKSTVAKPGFTHRAFNRDAARFSLRDGWTLKEADDKHGNEAYGRLVLAAVLGRLETAPPVPLRRTRP
jgi:hypothetical protein